MDKLVFRKFAKLVGNAEDLVPLANEYDEDYPEGWDEMSEEMKEEWKKKHMMKDNADKPTEPTAPVQNQHPTSPAPAAPKLELPAETVQLNALVKEIGGVEALRTLLLSAATVTANALQNEEAERKSLAESIKANSADFADSELAEMSIGTLRKVANMVGAPIAVDYSSLGAGAIKANKDDIAVMPDIFAAEFWKEK